MQPSLRFSFLIAVAVAVGCQSDPYERGQQEHAVLEADVMAVAQALVDKANRAAAEMDTRPFATIAEFPRVAVFVPGSESIKPRGEGPALKDADSAEPIPEDGIVQEWTDRFALVQQLGYRYSAPEIVEIVESQTPPYFSAEIWIRRLETWRSALGGTPQAVPSPPDGYVIWRPSGRDLEAGKGVESPALAELPTVTSLPGEPIEPGRDVDPLVGRALEGLAKSAPHKETFRAIVHLDYDHVGEAWQVRSIHGHPPRPITLRWTHGTYAHDGAYVFRPGEHAPSAR